jgi:8-oxo-dGTP diphosphatase
VPTPHIEVIARGLLVESGRTLVCRNIKHGFCYLPGGHVEFGESSEAALIREFEEECGQSVQVLKFAFASEETFSTRKRMHQEVNLVFHVERERNGDDMASREPELEFEWLARKQLAETDLRPKSIRAWLLEGTPASKVWMSNIRT